MIILILQMRKLRLSRERTKFLVQNCLISGLRLLAFTSALEVHNIQDLMPGDLRWSWCNHYRNKVHNKYNSLELSPNHPPTPGPWKNCLPWNQSLVLKRLGTTARRGLPLTWYFIYLFIYLTWYFSRLARAVITKHHRQDGMHDRN